MAKWAKLDDGTWGVSVYDSPYFPKDMVGDTVTVISRSGKRQSVTLARHVKSVVGRRGRHTDFWLVG